jgi:AcrR family transcriptional regulator
MKEPAVGRPREFDPDQALYQALVQFWSKGYEGASLTDLTAAMGVTRPTLYTYFGNKEELFVKALALYRVHYLKFFEEALARPTARLVIETLLRGSASALTNPATPAGCLGTLGALSCSEAAEPIKRLLAAGRAEGEAQLADRLEQARAAGDLPPDANPRALARYVMVITQGMTVQAASGVSREDLQAVVEIALRDRPAIP